MQTIKLRQYFTLADMANTDSYPFLSDDVTWNSFFVGQKISWIEEDKILQNLLHSYIWPEHYNSCVAYETAEVNPWEEPEEIVLRDDTREAFAGKVFAWINQTYPKYQKLLELYSSQEDSLLKQLTSSSRTLFNDTPQAGGNFETDPYVTNATLVQTKADTTTPMARLKEIQDNITNYYKEWADSFMQFIIYSA